MNRRISAFIVILILSRFCLGQEISDWIVVEGSAASQNITQEEALAKAVNKAKRNAIEKFCGVGIRAQAIVRDFMLGADIIEAISHGYIVESEILSIDREDSRQSIKDPFIDLIKVRMKVKVAKPEEEPDPYFKINAKLEKRVFTEGEITQLYIETTKDCFLHIFNITQNGKVYQIYPLFNKNNVIVKAGEVWQYPYRLVATCLPGDSANEEIIKIIGTKKEPLNFLEFAEKGKDFEIVQGFKVWKSAQLGLEQLMKTLISIPINDRREKTIVYKVFK